MKRKVIKLQEGMPVIYIIEYYDFMSDQTGIEDTYFTNRHDVENFIKNLGYINTNDDTWVKSDGTSSAEIMMLEEHR